MARFLRYHRRESHRARWIALSALLVPVVSLADESTPTLGERVRKLEAQLLAVTWQQDEVWRRDLFAVRINGFVQVDAVLFRQDSEDQLDGATGQPLNETRFVIRRARLRAEADAKYVGARLEIDGNTVAGTQVRLLGAEAWTQWPASQGQTPYLGASVGLFKIPFGREVQQYDPDRLFLERSSVVKALFPGEYDLGVRMYGGWRLLRYSVAAMNGEPSGEQAFAARDPNRSKDLVLRLGIDTDVMKVVKIRAGLSGVYGTGFSPGSLASKDVLSWRDDNDDGQVQLSEIQVILGRAATPSANFSRDALGVDAELTVKIPRIGALQISGELLWARNLDRGLLPADPIASGRDLRELGYYLGVTQSISSYARIGIRYDYYDPDADRQEQRAALRVPVSTAFSTLAVTAAVQHPRYGRLALEYNNNHNSLGRSASGIPTTLGRDSVVARAQVAF